MGFEGGRYVVGDGGADAWGADGESYDGDGFGERHFGSRLFVGDGGIISDVEMLVGLIVKISLIDELSRFGLTLSISNSLVSDFGSIYIIRYDEDKDQDEVDEADESDEDKKQHSLPSLLYLLLSPKSQTPLKNHPYTY